MAANQSISVSLQYGSSGRFEFELDRSRVVAIHNPPQRDVDFLESLQTSLQQPIDFPPLEQAVVPGDRVALAIDRNTPHAAQIVAEIWRIIERRSVQPSDISIVQPATLNGQAPSDPRVELPDSVRREVTWKIHDPTDEQQRMYLASTSTGERVYLAESVVDADLVLPIGTIAFDPVLGYRGTGSVLYPWLSTADDIARAHGQGHSELTPDNERPLRQMIDEIAWLLGIQLTIQLIAGPGGGVSQVLAGMSDSVFKRGKELLNQQWRVEMESRPDVVVAAVDSESTWETVGAALSCARSIVAPDGKIVLLTNLNQPIGDGMKIVQSVESPRDALKPLRLETPTDLIPASQLARAADWAKVYLLSGLEEDVVEDLFLVPLADEREVLKLLDNDRSCAVLAGAQHIYARMGDSE